MKRFKYEYDNKPYKITPITNYVVNVLVNCSPIKRVSYNRNKIVLSCGNIFKSLIKFNEDIRNVCWHINCHFYTDIELTTLTKCKTVDDIVNCIISSLDEPKCIEKRHKLVERGVISKNDLVLAY